MYANPGWQDCQEPKRTRTATRSSIVIVLVAATMVGASAGALIADPDALLFLKQNLASRFAGLLASPDQTGAKPEPPTVLATGHPSVVGVQYSFEGGSTRLAFHLQAADLVRTGRLRSPDRIYFDLRDHGRQQDKTERPATQKAVSITGDLLSGVRISRRRQGASRIVLDLKRSCDFTYETSPGPPARLMVELRPHPASLRGPLGVSPTKPLP